MSFSAYPIDSRSSRLPTGAHGIARNKTAVDWLTWLSTLLVDSHSLSLLDLNSRQFAHWPSSAQLPEGSIQLGLSAHESNEVVRAGIAENSDHALLAIPLTKSRFDGCTVLLVDCLNASSEQQKKIIHLVRWASEYRPCLSEHHADSSMADGIFDSEDSISDRYLASLSDTDSYFSWLDFVNLVCRCTSVKRVALASVSQNNAHIVAISDQANIDHRRELIRDLQQAMMVVHKEGRPSFSPSNSVVHKSDNASITPELQILQDRSWLMLPTTALGQQFVILLERSLTQNFSVSESEEIASQLNPALVAALIDQDTKRSLPNRFKARFSDGLSCLLLRKYRYLVQGLILLAMLLVLLVPVEHRVSASAAIAADDNHVLVVPIDAILSSVHVSAGDVVEHEQLLATFDDSGLKLQMQQWEVEAQKNYQEYNLALATRDRVELSRLRADAVRIEAQLEMVRQQQERFQIRAPIGGVVMSGQWEDSLGAALKSGEKLFEVGTLDDHRLVLSVPERNIDFVKPGQGIAFRMTANPTEKLSAVVESVSPVAMAKQGINTITVFARMNARDSGLRPGMQGVAKVLVGQESRAAQWMFGLRSRLIIWAWKLGLIK